MNVHHSCRWALLLTHAALHRGVLAVPRALIAASRNSMCALMPGWPADWRAQDDIQPEQKTNKQWGLDHDCPTCTPGFGSGGQTALRPSSQTPLLAAEQLSLQSAISV